MAAGVALLGTFLSLGGTAAHAAGCSQQPSCPYLDVSVLAREPATGAGVFRSPQAVAVSPGGSFIWVADQISGVVQKFDQQGNFISQLGWFADKGQLGRLGVIGGLATDRSNHLYVLDSQYGRVQVFRSDTGSWLGAWGSKGMNANQLDPGTDGGAGGIAVSQPTPQDVPVAFIADQNNHRVVRYTLDRFSTADSSGPVLPVGGADPGNVNYISSPAAPISWGSFGDCSVHGCGQPSDNLLLNHPQGIAVNPRPDSANRVLVYVADSLNQRAVEYTDSGTYLGEVGGLGAGQGQFNSPYDVSVDAAGSLYVADVANHRVERFNAGDLSFLGEWGTLGSAPGQLDSPRALASPADVNGVYVADTGNQRVQGFSETGSPAAAWGIAARGGPGYVSRPSGIAVDRSGNLYIGDTWAHRIEKLSSTGAYLGQWGRVIARTGLTTLGNKDGQFYFPRGVAFDPAGGNIWVADQNNHRIQVFTTTGAWLATYGGRGTALGQFSSPRALTVATNGDVYVADTGNNRIQKRSPSGNWSLVPTGTALDAPSAIAVDNSGTVFVADRTRVLRLDGGMPTSIDPPSGSFNQPGGLHVTPSRLYVSDTGSSRVLRLDRASGNWQQIGGEGPQVGSFVAPSELSTTQDGRILYVTDQHNNRIQRFVLEPPPASRSAGRSGTSTQPSSSRDRDRPRLRLRARLKQKAVRRGAVLVSVRCTERCLVDATGKLMIRHRRQNLRLRGIRRQLGSGARVTLALKLTKKARRKAGRALAHGWRVNARVVVIGRDLAGNSTREVRRVRVIRDNERLRSRQ
jgi:DNA-binding beta-propeller fold protein YncE